MTAPCPRPESWQRTAVVLMTGLMIVLGYSLLIAATDSYTANWHMRRVCELMAPFGAHRTDTNAPEISQICFAYALPEQKKAWF